MKYSIFTNDVYANIDTIDRIKNFLHKQFNDLDFVIFTNDLLYATSNHSILTTFYMIAYNGQVIFLNIDDYMEYKDTIKNISILYLSLEDINILDRNLIKNCAIITDIDNNLQWIPNYEL